MWMHNTKFTNCLSPVAFARGFVLDTILQSAVWYRDDFMRSFSWIGTMVSVQVHAGRLIKYRGLHIVQG